MGAKCAREVWGQACKNINAANLLTPQHGDSADHEVRHRRAEEPQA